MKILLVEDDELVAEALKDALTAQHYLVEVAADGKEGWELAEAFEYDLILLDWMLPKLDGLTFCKQRRQMGDRTPIMLLTAQDTSTKKVMGLDAGADDYIVKPFDWQELSARIRALLRRGSSTPSPLLEWGLLCLDPSNCQVTYDQQILHLTAKEYSLLELFLRNPQRIYSQSALLDHLWSFADPPSENTVRAHIKSLRQKLKKAGATADLIETVYGLGYRLKSKEELRSHSLNHTEDAANRSTSQTRSQLGKNAANNSTSATAIPKNPPSTPPNSTPTHSTESPIPVELRAIWERSKEKYGVRITILEQAIAAAIAKTLSEELRQRAIAEAHTLVGSLGSFGLMDASLLSREIQQAFQAQGEWSQTQTLHLSESVAALRQTIEQPLTPKHSVETVPSTPPPPPTTLTSYPRLLIVDDDAELALVLVSAASSWGIQAEIATDLSQARNAIARVQPDVVLLDLCFQGLEDNGFELLAELTTQHPPVPVVVFTAQESFAQRVKVARLGGRVFLQKPVSPKSVMAAIAQVLQQSSTPEAKLLIVDDDPQLLDFLQKLLEPWGFKITLLDNPQMFWDTLEQTVPDLVILDVEMPELSGIDLCQVLRNDPNWSNIPVLFLSVFADAHTVQQVFTAGADDYVSKPIVGPELVARILNRLERVQILRKLHKLMG